ncbi:metal ABC transporter ATP-binding protein [Thalassobaculum sp. OXR-137]|uniref:metal ABC transporter ATP-binding protein n=1 Tax=Thalassobaculum sp. OXR-137 TaxID=3100173 RepID=UPI002AC9E68E|nr:metal ABC transporter ATP-binding protein [Thalassobaculum sp. OXR-137]WPZ34283.1 metal ABC transporter ATP-binding protein [Thalassobaculum sp. OXR-137]
MATAEILPDPARAPDDVLVRLSGVGVQRAGRWLTRNVDLDVRPGEIVTLIGPNGSGKTTTAKVAAGVIRADEGRAESRRDLRVGYVPQKIQIDWTLPITVRRLMTLTSRHSPAQISQALEAVGIPHLAEAEVQSLSGGEFQRALLARAMVRRPNLLILDEPVQGVDFTGEVTLYGLIKRIRDETGCGILLISHDLHVVMAQTDTVVCLNGHVCCRGTPQTVAENPEYLRLFGGRAAGALAVYRHQHDHTHLPDGRIRNADGSITDGHAHDHDGHDHGHSHSHSGGQHGHPHA